MPRKTSNVGDVDLFDNPEYYKAALQEEQHENISLRILVLDLRRQLATKEREYEELLKSCTFNMDKIIVLEKSNALLVAENNKLSALSKDEMITEEKVCPCATNTIPLNEFDLSNIASLLPHELFSYLGFTLSTYNDLIQRISLLEAAVIQANITTMHVSGDFVMNKDNSLK